MKANNRFHYHFKKLIVTNRLMMLSYNSKGVLFPTIVNQVEERLELNFSLTKNKFIHQSKFYN